MNESINKKQIRLAFKMYKLLKKTYKRLDVIHKAVEDTKQSRFLSTWTVEVLDVAVSFSQVGYRDPNASSRTNTSVP